MFLAIPRAPLHAPSRSTAPVLELAFLLMPPPLLLFATGASGEVVEMIVENELSRAGGFEASGKRASLNTRCTCSACRVRVALLVPPFVLPR